MTMRQTPQTQRLMTSLVFFGAVLGFASRAAAEPRLGADRGDLHRQLVDLQRREREIDEKIRRIEAELARDAAARTAASRTLASAGPSVPPACILPFYLDSSGIKHLRPECVELAGRPSCDPPYNLDEHGVRRFRPACATGAAAPSQRGDE
jgi:hypothetical protein